MTNEILFPKINGSIRRKLCRPKCAVTLIIEISLKCLWKSSVSVEARLLTGFPLNNINCYFKDSQKQNAEFLKRNHPLSLKWDERKENSIVSGLVNPFLL